MISEKGSLKDIPVMKLLLTVFELGVTGILYIKRGDILKVLYFRRGKLIWAISNSDVDKLENILLSKGLADPETVRKVKMESRVSESLGKLLVEKGLITLEELIDASKEQLSLIINSVLKWRDGGFQFVKETPPERLLSLDLNITEFIVRFIVDEIDPSDIWNVIGTLQLELIKNPNEKKLERYNLTDRQRDLLNSFDGEMSLEDILSRHSGGNRESLLKIIYFFMMAELLIKKEFELSDASTFDPGVHTDSEADISPSPGREDPFKNDKTEDAGPSGEDLKSIKLPNRQTEQEMLLDLERTVQEIPPVSTTPPEKSIDTADTLHDDVPEPEEKRSFYVNSGIVREERKRNKLFNYTLILVFLILVIGGVILLVLPWLQSDSNGSGGTQKTDNQDIMTVYEPPVQQDSAGTDASGGRSEGKDKQGQGVDKKEGSGVKKNDPVKTDKTTQGKKESPKKAAAKSPAKKTPGKVPGKVVLPSSKNAFKYLREGNFIKAGNIWKQELTAAKIKFSILLELDCKKESVYHAYRLMNRGTSFFILNRKAGRLNCYLVMWGKFKTRQEATAGLKSVHNYFWKQKDPPEIVELKRYL
jgi:hypothetical protein